MFTRRFASYLPIIAAVIELPWLVVVGLAMWISVGDNPQPGHEPNLVLWSVIGVIPAALGALATVVAAIRGAPENRTQWISLVTGGIVCLAMVLQWGTPNGIIE